MLSSVYQTFRQKQLFLFQTSHCVSPQPRTLPSSPHYLCDEYLLACHSVVSELKTTHSSTHNSSRALILRRGMGGLVTSCNFFTKIWEVVLFESVSPHWFQVIQDFHYATVNAIIVKSIKGTQLSLVHSSFGNKVPYCCSILIGPANTTAFVIHVIVELTCVNIFVFISSVKCTLSEKERRCEIWPLTRLTHKTTSVDFCGGLTDEVFIFQERKASEAVISRCQNGS